MIQGRGWWVGDGIEGDVGRYACLMKLLIKYE